MTAYITFNVYDYSEFYLWDISTKKTDAVNSYIEKHLPSFLLGAQPDISILELRKVQIPTKTLQFLVDAVNKKDAETQTEVQKILKNLYDTKEEQYIYSFQGDDIIEVTDFYARMNNRELPEDSYFDGIDEILGEFNENEEEFKRAVKAFIEIV